MAHYLEVAIQQGAPTLTIVALGNIARVKEMTQNTELSRESLFEVLSPEANPKFASLKVVSALWIKLRDVPA
jgi:probable addiction module antidote protein